MTISAEDLVLRYRTPLYVYDLDVVRERARALREAIDYQPCQLLYAMKANSCPSIIKTLIEEGFGIDAVSPGEIALAQKLGASPIVFTESNATDGEVHTALQQGCDVTVGSLSRLDRMGRAGVTSAAVRINPEVGASEHAHTLTAGPLTKFGIHYSQVDDLLQIERETRLKITGVHMHIGSGSLDSEAFVTAMGVILDLAKRLPHLKWIDFGGGIGVPYKPEDVAIDIKDLGSRASEMMKAFCADYGRELEMRLEPGRYLVAECGTLYTTVTNVQVRPAADGDPGRTFIGCDSGFNHLIRPCMYGSYHPITNASRPNADRAIFDVVGNICESGDVFARDRELPTPRAGDVLAIGCAGAYGMTMASTYNMRPLPAEVVIDGDRTTVVRPRQTIDDLIGQWDWDAIEPAEDDDAT